MQASGAVPHTALIYEDRQDRNRLIESCLDRTGTRWNSLTVLGVHPDDDARVFRNLIRRKSPKRGQGFLSVIDVREPLARKKNAAGSMLSIVRRARHAGHEMSPSLIIGDWTHRVYDEFQTAMVVEEAEEGMPNTICCYRGEGFWSLNPGEIARIFELHNRVVFGSTVLEMSV